MNDTSENVNCEETYEVCDTSEVWKRGFEMFLLALSEKITFKSPFSVEVKHLSADNSVLKQLIASGSGPGRDVPVGLDSIVCSLNLAIRIDDRCLKPVELTVVSSEITRKECKKVSVTLLVVAS